MESPRSVNSPRRILSLSKQRVSFQDSDDKTGFGLSGEHGPKPSEVYGFVGSITVVVASVIFLIWAYVPEHWLHSIGITYYPSRYWALAVPTYVMVTIVLGLGFYIGLNFMSTPSPASLNTIYEIPLVLIALERETTSPLSPFQILISAESTISCSEIQPRNPWGILVFDAMVDFTSSQGCR
ncbi:uncharacterized protein LOC114752594 isoform X1 [Neltuma alba]|uniref:uncharacterized protein LOC114734628 isoform X1 n=1 Tax=Neltuma alba TaxID=207710 RepID=UPI0010A3AAEA|nr:uncharacterized protein LOC114734628 isoform X1 [Prosopis alba]XP_028778093.1 uncharacterized protein LOC114734628 isoform X1 [Prosopis alba]XP_028778094.1 uncharacterized protein LOC114734628 isoform X1 [Prosopis alba]XP_028778095.1 uncharacterized protein LOC114734628 isoform X1 [Prosopis alba]XP_028797183.1 uncharacterized protein LOC114752594 isoform X1 [Prosopis alba]XP_028797184.1 uncharacterized protein LOC114752594 isoform X1 [Prosopis alba]XP_028797185.1 uncharacterized protein LO